MDPPQTHPPLDPSVPLLPSTNTQAMTEASLTDPFEFPSGKHPLRLHEWHPEGGETCVGLSYDKLCQNLKPGNVILLDDGSISNQGE